MNQNQLHTPGPWHAAETTWEDGIPETVIRGLNGAAGIAVAIEFAQIPEMRDANARLISAAPELLEALQDCVDALWHIDSHAVQFDDTVMFGSSYDFSGLDGGSREEFIAEYECVVWPSGGKWSAYCTYEGSTWFDRFDTASDAKEQCMKLLDRVLPDHPAMRARAAIAKATGAKP